jgi:hypothetical protein
MELNARNGTSTLAESVTRNAAASTTPGTPPVVQVNGDNPAVIHVGDTYADLGATITGPTADLNLGIKTFLNGQLVSNIVLDTSSMATDTIDYVAGRTQSEINRLRLRRQPTKTPMTAAVASTIKSLRRACRPGT